MKRLLQWILCLAFVALMSNAAFAQASGQLKIATVDLSRVFTNYWKTKQADLALQDMKAELTKSDKELIDARQKAVESYNKLLADANNQAVSAEERDRRKKAAEDKFKEIKDMENNIEQFEKQARTRLSEQSLRMRDNLLMEIRSAIDAKAKTGGYTVLLDKAAQTVDRTPVILFSVAEDVTEAVLTQLNAGAPLPTDDKKK
jgi:outer membrane protein